MLIASRRLLATALVAGAAAAVTAAPAAARGSEPLPTVDAPTGQQLPIVIGHRGAPGFLPEHTLEGYLLAMFLGADYVEPDLVATKDGALLDRHEPNIVNTTDVASHPEFADRRRTAVVDGREEEGFFASDFTLAELKTLRAVQPLPEDRTTAYDGRFQVPTLDEVIGLARLWSFFTGRTVGVYPETKHPTYHRELGLPLEDEVVRTLARHGLNRADAPVFLQSFEVSNLIYLKSISPVRRVQLLDANGVNDDGTLDYNAPYDLASSDDPTWSDVDYGDLVSDRGLDFVSQYADGIGPWKRYIVGTVPSPADAGAPGEAARRLAPPTDLIERAHERGLLVHAYTFRSEPRRLAADYGGSAIAEYQQFFRLGLDGVFADQPNDAVTARTLLRLDSVLPSAG